MRHQCEDLELHGDRLRGTDQGNTLADARQIVVAM
jgi:hypothetical protein